MLPHITQQIWAKSSQWLALSRKLAGIVDSDELVVELFAKHCLPGRRCVGDVSHPTLFQSNIQSTKLLPAGWPFAGTGYS